MPLVRKNCPRCEQFRLVGPWRGDPKYTELCGPCKINTAFSGKRREKFVARVQGELSTAGIGAKLEFDLSEDKS